MAKDKSPKKDNNRSVAINTGSKPITGAPIEAAASSCFHAGKEYSPGCVKSMDGPRGPKLMICTYDGIWEER